MEHCPHCAAPLDGLVPYCWHCGRDVKEPVRPESPERTASEPRPIASGAAPSAQQVAEQSSDAADATRAEVAANPARPGLPRRALAFAGVAGVLASLATMLVIGRDRIDTPEPARPLPAASNNVPAPQPADPEPIIESASAPTWVGARRATWARDGSKTITFRLAASNDVRVWMKNVQPLLVVRCLSRTTEVFVASDSAASVEPQAGSHTVHIQFDDAVPFTEQWSDSVSSQELYAPDGVALARRLARTRTLRFGFTPFNSAPVVAEFHVRGFDKFVGLVAGTCGWRVDGSRPAERRRAEKRRAALD